MQGVHAFNPKARTSIDLESFVSRDHWLRRINRVLDLSFVRELTEDLYAAGKGRPSIDPEVFFRMQLVAYLNGITSDRQLCEEIRYNLAYRWFCRLSLEDDVPNHSSLTRIRDRLGEKTFEAVFLRIVVQCKKKGLVKSECRVMTDATLIAANASLNSLVNKDPKLAEEEQKAQEQRRGTIDAKTQRKVSNQTHHSATDPDATLAQKKGTPRQLKYKVHQTIDADSRVILDTEVTTGGRHDNQPYLNQLKRVSTLHKLTITEAIADRGYGSAEIIRSLRDQGIATYIPLWNRRSGNNSGTAEGLEYDREHDRFRCAAGKYLLPNEGNYDNRKRYSTESGQCRECELASACVAKNRPKAKHTRFVYRSFDQDLFDEVQSQMKEKDFRKRVSERMWKSEGLFAEAKALHALARAKYRGKAKVQIQAFLSGMAQNLKRLLFLLYQWCIVLYGSSRRWQNQGSVSKPFTTNHLREIALGFSTARTLCWN